MKLRKLLTMFSVGVSLFAVTTITASAMQLTENTTIDGDCTLSELCINDTQLDLAGYTLTINGDLDMDSSHMLCVSGGSVLDVSGDVNQYSGRMMVNGGEANIGGNYNLDGGSLDVSGYSSTYGDNIGSVNIDGSWIVGGNYSPTSTSSGTTGTIGSIDLKGNLQVGTTASLSGLYKIVFSGTGNQTVMSNCADAIDLGYISSTNSRLRFDPNSTINFSVYDGDSLVINSNVTSEAIAISNNANVVINGDLTSSYITMTGGSLDIAGDLTLGEFTGDPLYPSSTYYGINLMEGYGGMTAAPSVIHTEGDCILIAETTQANISLSPLSQLDIDGSLVYSNISLVGMNANYSGKHVYVGGDILDRNMHVSSLDCGIVLDGRDQNIIAETMSNAHLYLTKSFDNYTFSREDWGNLSAFFPVFDVPLVLADHLTTDLPDSVVCGTNISSFNMTIGGVKSDNSRWCFDISYNGFDKVGTATVVINGTAPFMGKVTKEIEVLGTNPVPEMKLIGNEAHLEWEAVKGAAGYSIMVNGNILGTSENTEFTIPVTTGETYTVCICPVASDMAYYYDGTYSSALTFTVDGSEAPDTEEVPDAPEQEYVLNAPENVTAASDDGEILVNWDAAENATAYSIRRHDGTGWSDIATVSATAYKDVSVTEGIIYIYTVTAVNAEGTSVASEPAAALIIRQEEQQTLNAPVVQAEEEASSIVLRWNSVDGASAYSILRYDGKAWIDVATVKACCYSDIDITKGTEYTYAVYAVNDKCRSLPSHLVTGCIEDDSSTEEKPSEPEVPVDTTVKNIKTTGGNNSVTMTWDAVSGATKYAVYVFENGAYVCKSNAVTGTSYTFTGLTNGTQYSFRVKAYVNGSWKAASSTVYGTPISSGIPQNIRTTGSDGAVTMSWDAVSGATKYAVYMQENGSFVCKANAVTGTSYTFSGLTNGTRYAFRVKSYVNGVWKVASSTVYGTPEA